MSPQSHPSGMLKSANSTKASTAFHRCAGVMRRKAFAKLILRSHLAAATPHDISHDEQRSGQHHQDGERHPRRKSVNHLSSPLQQSHNVHTQAAPSQQHQPNAPDPETPLATPHIRVHLRLHLLIITSVLVFPDSHMCRLCAHSLHRHPLKMSHDHRDTSCATRPSADVTCSLITRVIPLVTSFRSLAVDVVFPSRSNDIDFRLPISVHLCDRTRDEFLSLFSRHASFLRQDKTEMPMLKHAVAASKHHAEIVVW